MLLRLKSEQRLVYRTNSLNGIRVVDKLHNCGRTLILFVKEIFTRFCLLWTFIILMKWSVILTFDTPEVTSEESLRPVVAITLIGHATLISEYICAQCNSLCTTTA